MQTVKIEYTQTLAAHIDVNIPDDVDPYEWLDEHRDEWEDEADAKLELTDTDFVVL